MHDCLKGQKFKKKRLGNHERYMTCGLQQFCPTAEEGRFVEEE